MKKIIFYVFIFTIKLNCFSQDNNIEKYKDPDYKEGTELYDKINRFVNNKDNILKFTQTDKYFSVIEDKILSKLNFQEARKLLPILHEYIIYPKNKTENKCFAIDKILLFLEKDKIYGHEDILIFLREFQNLNLECSNNYKKRIHNFDYMTDEYYLKWCFVEYDKRNCSHTFKAAEWIRKFRGCNKTIECQKVNLGKCGNIYTNKSFSRNELQKIEKICKENKYEIEPKAILENPVCRDAVCVPEEKAE